MIPNSGTKTYLNTCDLYLEQAKLGITGYFYIVWKKGKKVTQTLKYHSNGKKTIIQQNLTLNISLDVRNGRTMEKNTSLYVLDAQGKQIDEIILPINKWINQYNRIQLKFRKGEVIAKAKRKSLMEVEGLGNSEQESIQEEKTQEYHMESMLIRSEQSSRKKQYIDAYKDEMNKIRKELEDTSYYNNKLKNDRAVLISRNLQLESQLEMLKSNLKTEIANLQKHYKAKIQSRETIYQQQINNIITSFNSHYQCSMLLKKILTTQNTEKGHQIAFYKGQYQKLQKQVDLYGQKLGEIEEDKNSLRQNLQKQCRNFEQLQLKHQQSQQLIMGLQTQKSDFESQLHNWKQNASKLEIENAGLFQQLQLQKEEIGIASQEKQKLMLEIKQLKEQCDMYKNQLDFTEGALKKETEANQKSVENYEQHLKILGQQIEELQGSLKQSQVFKQQTSQHQIKLENVDLQLKEAKKKCQDYENYISELEVKIERIQPRITQLQRQLSLKEEEVDELKENMKQSQIDGNQKVNELTRLLKEQEEKIKQQRDQKQRQQLQKETKEIDHHQQQIEKLPSQQEIQNPHQMCEKEMSELKETISKLEVQLAFVNQNTIKIQEHETLLQRLKQMETLLFQAKSKQPNQNKHLSVNKEIKEDQLSNKSQVMIQEAEEVSLENLKIEAYDEKNEDEINSMISEKTELEMLRKKCKRLEVEKKEIETKMELLTVEMAKKYHEQMEKLNVEEVQYCSSEQLQNKQLENQREENQQPQQYPKQIERQQPQTKQTQRWQPQTNKQPKQTQRWQPETKNVRQEDKSHTNQGRKSMEYESKGQTRGRIRKSNSVQINHNQYLKYRSRNMRSQQNIIEEEGQQSQRGKQTNEKNNIKFVIPDDIDLYYQNSPQIKQSKQFEKSEDKQSNASKKSPSSYRSGTTYYKFKKVSHSEKIVGLEKQVKSFERKEIQWHERQNIYKQETKRYCEQLEKSKEILELKQQQLTKQLELTKQLQLVQRAQQQSSKHTQTYIETQSKSIEADIPDPQKIRVQKQLHDKNQEFDTTVHEYDRKFKEDAMALKYMKEKNEEFQKYSEGILKVSEQRQSQIHKLKEQVDEAQRNKKEIIQDSKIKVSQLQFQLGTSQSETKRLKLRIEELEDKLRKNDVMDLYKQAQYEAESVNKKNIEMNRNLYQIKLEKDSLEDQIKILRKKISDLNRKISELEDSNQRSEKAVEEHKKRNLRQQRQLEDRDDHLDKQREQNKRLTDQISNLKAYQSQYLFEKKKIMEDQNSMQHQIDRKEYQLTGLKKQMDRYKQLCNEKQQQKITTKNILNREIQKLEKSLSNKNKQIDELESTIKHLNARLENQQNENKKNIGQKSNLYSQKLRAYVEEIAEIRKLLEGNNFQINSLKVQLRQATEQLENALNREKRLEQKYKKQSQIHQQLVANYEQMKLQSQSIKQSTYQTQCQMQNIRNSIKLIKSDLQREKKQGALKSQQIQQLNKTNENNINLINKYKVRLSDFETSSQINKNFSQKLTEAENANDNLSKEIRQLKYQYEEYRGKFIHTTNDLTLAVKKNENKWKDKLEYDLSQLQNQLESTHSTEKKRYENQLVDLLNETARLRAQSQKKSDLISQLEHNASKMEVLPLKIQELQTLYKDKEAQCYKYRQISASNPQLTEKLNKLEDNYHKISQQNYNLNKTIATLKNDLNKKEQLYKEVKFGLEERQNMVKLKNDAIGEKQLIERNLKCQIERLLAMVQSTERQREMLLKKMEDNKIQYTSKVESLEIKLNLMGNTVQEHQQQLQIHFEAKLEELKKQIEGFNHELEQKTSHIITLEDIVTQTQNVNSDLKKQIQSLREKEVTDADLFDMEITKLNMKMEDMEKLYKSNTDSLEAELSEKHKQLTALRMKQQSASFLKMSGSGFDDRNMSYRLEQKIKAKDAKIEQLKTNIFMYEETLVKLKKNLNQAQQYGEEIKRLEKVNADLCTKKDQLTLEVTSLNNKSKSLISALKEEVSTIRAESDQYKLLYEEKVLEKQSTEYELKTTKELYLELQRELDKRKLSFRDHTEEESKFNETIHEKNQYIQELQEKLTEYQTKSELAIEDNNKKNQAISRLESKLGLLEKSESRLKLTLNSKTNEEGRYYKQQIISKTEENEELCSEIKRLKSQNQQLHRQNADAKTQLSFSQSSLDTINSNFEDISGRCRQYEIIVKKYHQINDLCIKNFMMNLEDAIMHNGLSNLLQQKEFQLTNMVQEVQELKFLNERKYMDYDELKKAKYEMQIQLEDAQFANEQVQDLRELCDKLEQEKKQAVFREEFIILQLQNMIKNSSGQAKSRMLELMNAARRAQI